MTPPSGKAKRPITFREEANAITCYAFRNGLIEELHAGEHSAWLEQPGLMRVTSEECERMLSEGAARLGDLRKRKQAEPTGYWQLMIDYNKPGGYVANWDRDEPATSRRRPPSGPVSRPVTPAAEARCIAEYTFGQSHIVELIQGDRSPLLERPELSRITQLEMALIMIGTSLRMAELFLLEIHDPARYAYVLSLFNAEARKGPGRLR